MSRNPHTAKFTPAQHTLFSQLILNAFSTLNPKTGIARSGSTVLRRDNRKSEMLQSRTDLLGQGSGVMLNTIYANLKAKPPVPGQDALSPTSQDFPALEDRASVFLLPPVVARLVVLAIPLGYAIQNKKPQSVPLPVCLSSKERPHA